MKYIKYRLRLQEPVRIADDSSAKQGQAMTLRYIPGSTIRGYVVNRLSSARFFSGIKKELFSERVRFHNAYLTVGNGEQEQVLLPSPKGFYEDKSITEGEKVLQNVVVNGEFDETFKRAKIGTNVWIEPSDSTGPDGAPARRMSFYTPGVISDTKIRLGEGKEQEIFRSTSIQAGYSFSGYIALDDPDLAVDESRMPGAAGEILADVLLGTVRDRAILGNARSSGLGKCVFESACLTEEIPYASLAMKTDAAENDEDKADDGEKECYMMLLSDTVMRNAYGEYCGLDIPSLERILGVKNLKIRYCSTSVTDIRGFNRHYGGAIASAVMYEKGSVFHLSYTGLIDGQHLDALHRRGIGVRRNEGYGQVLLIGDYENLQYKQKGAQTLKTDSAGALSSAAAHAEDEAVIMQAAKAHFRNLLHSAMREYVVNTPLAARHTTSQLGNILSIALESRFRPADGWAGIDRYFSHKIEKEGALRVHTSDSKISSDPLYRNVILKIKTTPLSELLPVTLADPEHRKVMGIPIEKLLSEQEEKRIRLELLIQLIRYDFKKEVKA